MAVAQDDESSGGLEGAPVATKKKWTALHYLVSVTDGAPESDEQLRDAAEKEICAIVSAGQAHFSDMHVAVQCESWHGVGTGAPPVRQARRWKVRSATDVYTETGALAVKDPEGPGEKPEPLRGDDLRAFFAWTKTEGAGHSPAEHIAIFFWGHSAGPAGIFDLFNGSAQQTSVLPDPLAGGRSILQQAGDSVDPILPGILANSLGELDQRCDVVLFKDCWMSTLEVAYELAPMAGAIIASQSLIPIAGQWPYDRLYRVLMDMRSAADLMPADSFKPLLTKLVDLYESDEMRVLMPDGRPFCPSVPFTLLDLTKVSPIQRDLRDLVKALGRIDSLTPEQQESRRAFDESSTGLLPKAAGDIALVDVLTLCSRLAAFPSVSAAAVSVGKTITKVIVANAASRSPGKCTGISLFYRPSRQAEPLEVPIGAGTFDPGTIMKAMQPNKYLRLRLNTLPDGWTDSWSDIAFEQQG